MPNETTKGAGRGAPRATREPLPAPAITRGAMRIPGAFSLAQFHDGARYTFTLSDGAFHMTYHDAEVISVRADELSVFVGPFDVVTWEQA